MKVLLVDDSRTVRNTQKNTLAQLGHTDVTEARDGAGALMLLQRDTPDLALIDAHMPNLDGIDLVRKIRDINRTLPLILCMTEADKGRATEAIRAGANDCIIKPFSATALAEKIEKATATLVAAKAG